MSKRMTTWLVAAAVLIVLGLVLLAVVVAIQGGDVTVFGAEKYDVHTYEVTEEFRDISLRTDTAAIVFTVSQDDTCRVVCHETAEEPHDVMAKNGTLTVSARNERKWYEYIGIHWGTPAVTVYLPKGEYGALVVDTDTGAVTIPQGLLFDSMEITGDTGVVKNCASVAGTMKIHTDTGAIRVENVTAKAVDLTVSTGAVTVSGITCEGNVAVHVSTGKAAISDVTCQNLISDGDTGDLLLTNVVAKEAFSIQRSTGDVNLDGCDAAILDIETDTGDVRGSLLSEKVFLVSSDTGRINVPKTVTGGRCEISTDTGDIVIAIRE